jgi:uncharacterized protein (TIGR00295 family)
MNPKKYLRILYETGCPREVIIHSQGVYEIAMKIVKKLEDAGIMVNKDVVAMGALLHDIGRSRTQGIQHAIEGAKIARQQGLPPAVVSIIEHHIGAGIDKEEAQVLGLPLKDYIPKTLEEEIVAHADNLCGIKDIATLIKCFQKKGNETGADRLKKLHNKLEKLCHCNLHELL